MTECVQALPATNLAAIFAVCLAFGWCAWWAGVGLRESEKTQQAAMREFIRSGQSSPAAPGGAQEVEG